MQMHESISYKLQHRLAHGNLQIVTFSVKVLTSRVEIKTKQQKKSDHLILCKKRKKGHSKIS